MQVISVTPTDPQALAKLGELHHEEGDNSQAFQYYYEVQEGQLSRTICALTYCLI